MPRGETGVLELRPPQAILRLSSRREISTE